MLENEESINEINNQFKAFLDNDEILSNIAKIIKKLHVELVSEGFSKEEATHIVSNFKIN